MRITSTIFLMTLSLLAFCYTPTGLAPGPQAGTVYMTVQKYYGVWVSSSVMLCQVDSAGGVARCRDVEVQQ